MSGDGYDEQGEIRELRDQVATLRGQLAERALETDHAALWERVANLVHDLDHRGDGRMADDDTYDIVARCVRNGVRVPHPPEPGAFEKLRELGRESAARGYLAGVDVPDMIDELRGVDPIPMVLFCPACGRQHVDAPNPAEGWDNPVHRSHKCHACAHVWRPADVATEGVESITTVGQVDTDPPIRHRVSAVTRLVHVTDDDLLKEDLAELWDRRKADRTHGSAEQRLSRASMALVNAGCEPGDFDWMLLQAVGAVGYRRAREPQFFIRDELRKLEKLGRGVSDVLVRYSAEDQCFIGRVGSTQAHGPTVESALVELCVALALANIHPRVNEGDSNPEPRPQKPLFPGHSGHPCCWKCAPTFAGMLLCATCGNKRCPHASDHDLACTNSNEAGQVGSVYAGPLDRPTTQPKGEQEDR